jgi:beta-1,4-mannosyl-glycoprotein beta-1,4-N-acetylglucosaminyltransferase
MSRKVYDCIMFYNEFDLLELRLQEMWDSVDHFVISEMDHTFSNKPKDYLFLKNQARFDKYMSKIIHVPVKSQCSPNFWDNESYQRDNLVLGLVGASDDDIAILSDCDEIIRPSIVDRLRADTDHDYWSLRMPLFYYKLNYVCTDPHLHNPFGQAMTIGYLKGTHGFDYLRRVYANEVFQRAYDYDQDREATWCHAGWQFSYLGGDDFVANKLRAFSHSEYAGYADNLNLEDVIARRTCVFDPRWVFKVVAVDDYFPKTILDNPEKYAEWVLTDATDTTDGIMTTGGVPAR